MMGKRIGDIPPADVGILCRHRKAKTRRGWGLCPKCHAAYVRKVAPERVQAITEKRRAEWRAYYERNKERIRRASWDPASMTEAQWKAWKKKDVYLRHRYGITIFQFNKMLRDQDCACPICRRTPKTVKGFHVDHDHVTGRVRGLLCWRCNYALPGFRDDPTMLRRAADYCESAFDGRSIDPEVIGRLLAVVMNKHTAEEHGIPPP